MKKIIIFLLNVVMLLTLTMAGRLVYAARPDPVDGATFVSQSVPASMIAGQTYNVSVTMLNAGTSSWTNQYQLISANPEANTTWGINSVTATNVAPHAQLTFNFSVVAPQAAGNYNFQWRMQGDVGFGIASQNVVVNVVALAPTISVQRSPSPVVAGQGYTVNWSSTNSTSVSYSCAAGGSGYRASASVAPSGALSGTADVSWVGYPTTCTWTATGPGGSVSTVETMTTLPRPNTSEFVSQSVPGSMVVGQTYAVSVTMKNTGTNTWSSAAAHQLGSANPLGNTTWGAMLIPLAGPVAPGQLATFTFNVVAPATVGTYNFQWSMIQLGIEWFGPASPNVAVSVVPTPPAISVQRTPTTLVAGQNFVTTWSSSNATAVSNTCVASGSGFVGSQNLATSGSVSAIASAAWVGNPSVCTWTATGPGGSRSVLETVTTLPPPNNSHFVSQTVPGNMTVGQVYNVAVTFKNSGSNAWSSGAAYNLASRNPVGNGIWGQKRVVLPAPVASGQQVTFAFAVTAPAAVGTYDFQWGMTQDGVGAFGAVSPDIAVKVAAVGAGSASSDVPVAIAIADIAQLGNPDAGALSGTMGVGNGATTYSLPIALPPGVMGVLPNLSINYSSTNTSGVAGLGWSVGGLSSIDRCGKTYASNGTTDAARFLPADRLCLDGHQLMLVNGDGANDAAYWSDGAEYRTEIETFSRITAALTSGRRSFKVQTKSGQTLYYGDRADTYLAGQGRSDGLAHRWWLSGSVDRSGNMIGYWYSVDAATGESQLASVQWGGNQTSGQAMFARADLSYELRPDAHVGYVSGSHFDERLRLTTISTRTDTTADGSGGTVAQRYTFTYDLSPSSGRSLLKSVQTCDGANVCLPATTFKWGKPNPSALHKFVSLGGVRQGPNLAAMASESVWYTHNAQDMIAIGDFNGDGRSDMLERYRVSANGYQQRLFLSNADGSGWTVSTPMTNISGQVMEVGDFDGDGQLDLLVADQAPGQYAISNWRICHSHLRIGGGFVCDTTVNFPADAFNKFSPPHPSRLVADFNGDGKDDIFLSAGNTFADKQYKCLSTGSAFNCTSVGGTREDMLAGDFSELGHIGNHPTADMDGDGRADQVMLGSCKYQATDNPAPGDPRFAWACPDSGPISAYTRSPGTFDYRASWFAFPNNQTAVLDPAVSGALTSDLNADGLTDIVFGTVMLDRSNVITATNAYVCYSKGGSTADCRPLPASGGGFDHEVVTVGDFDGDGVPDVLRPSHDTWKTENITGYQLCHIGADAKSHSCVPWDGPTFYTKSAMLAYVQPALNVYSAIPQSFFSGDFNGDGKQDIVSYLGGANWEISAAADQARPGEAIDKLLSATNGIGFVERVEYATVNDATVYTDVAYDINGQAIQPAYPVKRAPRDAPTGQGAEPQQRAGRLVDFALLVRRQRERRLRPRQSGFRASRRHQRPNRPGRHHLVSPRLPLWGHGGG